MFSFYGSKRRLERFYPKPIYDVIVEPFAGSAQYSMYYKPSQCFLNDIDSTIYGIWSWLVNEANYYSIIDNKDFMLNDNISNLHISQKHKNLIGFCINRGSVSPCNIITKWSCQSKINPNYASSVSYRLQKIANNLEYIQKSVKPSNLNYEEFDNIEATWFIDPPYQTSGQYYKHNNKQIDYNRLAKWCVSRKGQVIVCENSEANWLPFKKLKEIKGSAKNKTTECFTEILNMSI